MNCPVCRKYFNKKDKCVEHINSYHSDELERTNMDACQLLYASTHNGSIHGECMCGCGAPTEWNYKTGKPYKITFNPECKKRLYRKAEDNMQKARGVSVHSLLNDMEHQKDMQSHRPTHGVYKFSDGGTVDYLSSLEQNFLKFCDLVLEFTSNMFAPCPEYFTYYDPKDKVERKYIPDYYLPDYNLIVEIKDGGKKHNTNPAYVEETGYKVKLKDDVMQRQTKYNYIRISGANYGPFVETLYQIVHEQKPMKNQPATRKNLVVITEAACIDPDEQNTQPTDCDMPDELGVSCEYYLMVKPDNAGNLYMSAITRKSLFDTWVVYDSQIGIYTIKLSDDPYFDEIGISKLYRYLPRDRYEIHNAYTAMMHKAQAGDDAEHSGDMLDVLSLYDVYFDNGRLSNNNERKMEFVEVDLNQTIQEAVDRVSALFSH